MSKLRLLSAAIFAGLVQQALAETIQLKDKVTLNAQIITEKRDRIFVDLGYTILEIPRSQVVKIFKGEMLSPQKNVESTPAAGMAAAPSSTASHSEGYRTALLPPPVKDVRELVNLLGEAVVQVRTPAALGSGFFINEDGFLITNFHVIEGETEISIEVYHQTNGQLERKVYKNVRIVSINKFQDMALLRIVDKEAPKFKYVLLGDADNLAVGENVFAIGSPLGLERTVTQGIVSTKTREMGGELYLQTSTQINPGNSGGPLFNMRGEAVGITNMKITFGEGLGFAIPVGAVKFFLDHRDAFAYSSDNPGNPYRYLPPPSRFSKDDSKRP